MFAEAGLLLFVYIDIGNMNVKYLHLFRGRREILPDTKPLSVSQHKRNTWRRTITVPWLKEAGAHHAPMCNPTSRKG